ncbi:hypothetical protein [Actinoplanes aureus]|jgi:hypothetical protein|uniref:Spore-associated protein A n=1 Tax=Actinoplanes aureus TaxID=2792083 RepID=A0A931C6W9_9ACTN|nr:hypothetical protein [Actinoplanes aureus]MBG0564534.1 hypothetical protein [Actinoplanes aureus]
MLKTRIGAAAVALAAGVTTIATGSAPAIAADVNPYSASAICGSGYSVIDKQVSEGEYYMYLLYNSSNGKNCAVTLKQANLGTKTLTDVYLIGQKNAGAAEDYGKFEYYAGPVYLYAPNECIQWGGFATVGGSTYYYNSPWEHCG